MLKLLRERPVRAELLRIADAHPEHWKRFCVAIAQAEGWSCLHAPDDCVTRMRRILNSGHRKGHAPRNFDIDWGYLACDWFPESALPEMFPKRAAIAQARAEMKKAGGRGRRAEVA